MKNLFVFTASLFLAGCAQTTPLVVGLDHPANPDAPAAPLVMPSATLAISATPGAPSTSPASPALQEEHDVSHVGHSAHATAPPSSAEPATQPSKAATYVCPMHPDVVSDKPGICPKCKMQLVKKGGAR